MTTTAAPDISLADIPGLIRRARRHADMSQRDLALAANMSAGAVARAELDGSAVSLAALLRILAATGLRLAVHDADGAEVRPMRADSLRDNAGRRYPAHLDARLPSWPRGFGAGAPRSRPVPSLYCEQRRRRDLERDRTGAVPADHPGTDDRQRMHDDRVRAQREARERLAASRPPEPPLADCFCGPECETYCQPTCGCQCEPRPGRPANLIRRWPAPSAEPASGDDPTDRPG
jgi:HTH-type transcriptional regulator/antitoxin HipB